MSEDNDGDDDFGKIRKRVKEAKSEADNLIEHFTKILRQKKRKRKKVHGEIRSQYDTGRSNPVISRK